MIHFTTELDGLTSRMLTGFFVGWAHPPSPEMHLRLLQQSNHVCLAIDNSADDSSSRIIGFITAISDGVLAAYISLLEVLPSYQRQGIGKELIRRMLHQLQHFYMVDLLCDPSLEHFYSKCGMHPTTGMMIRNYARQSGDNLL